MGIQARRFVEYLRAAGQSHWQVLPLNPPARGDSPYSAYSVFAGNPYFIDLPMLVEENLLPAGDLPQAVAAASEVDYHWCAAVQMDCLRKAFAYSGQRLWGPVRRFRAQNAFWLPDYALFMALRGTFDNRPYQQWPEEYRMADREVLLRAERELVEEIHFWEYVQFLFYSQWRALKRFANSRGVRLIGDMPIYVDVDSADVWSNPQVFALTPERYPEAGAGVPPDAFSADGQLWGNPLYNWKHLRRTKYQWWVERVKYAGNLYDTVRIDHFRGLSSYWAVPTGAKSAKVGTWFKGPGMELLQALQQGAPRVNLIAEDLGLLDDGVRLLLRKSGLPGMKVLQFAFSVAEESDYLPHNVGASCVVYTGTHDNDTVQSWMKTAPAAEVAYARQYLRIKNDKEVHWDFIRGLYGTAAQLAMVPMQDVLGLDENSRMNKPGIANGNWRFRLLPEQIALPTAQKLRQLALVYRRCR